MHSAHHAKAEVRKAQMLDLLATRKDLSIAEMCAQVGIAKDTYYGWRRVDKGFQSRCALVQAGQQLQIKIQKHGGGNGGQDEVAAATTREGDDDSEVNEPHRMINGDFAQFRAAYFPPKIPSAPFHYEIVNIIENAPPMSVTLILVPPNFGKTTIIEDYICWKLGEDPNHRFTIVSKSQPQARKMSGHIQRRMTDAKNFGGYIGRYGPFMIEGQQKAGKPWTRDYFTVARADHDERDYSVQVIGWTGQVYGSRIDTLILDDIQTRDNLSSVEEMLNKFNLEYMSRGDSESRVVIVGTRIEVGDIYEHFAESDLIDPGQLYVMPAMSFDEDGEAQSLWPERWPVDILERRRQQVGEKAWWCGYMMNPQRGGQATFTEELINRAKNPTRRFGPLQVTDPSAPQAPVILGLDPALGGGNALVAMAYSSTKIWILDAIRETGLARTEDILLRIEQFAQAYRPRDLVVEQNAFQRGLARDDRLLALAARFGFRIHEHATNRNKQDPILGVGSMAGSFLRSEFDIPDEDELSQARMRVLIAELLAWRPDLPTRMIEQDIVMAMWFGWMWIMGQRRSMGVDTSVWNRPGLAQWTRYDSLSPRAGNGGYL